MKKFFLIFSLILLSPYFLVKAFEYNWKLSVVPKELNVYRMAYSKEETGGGFGPGVNEGGIRVFVLPEKIAHVIEEEGVGFLNSMPSNICVSRSGLWARVVSTNSCYREWYPTPLQNNNYHFEDWLPETRSGRLAISKTPSIVAYINKYWRVQIDTSVEEFVDEAIRNEGSYYSYSNRMGVLIVIPRLRRVVYAYHG